MKAQQYPTKKLTPSFEGSKYHDATMELITKIPVESIKEIHQQIPNIINQTYAVVLYVQTISPKKEVESYFKSPIENIYKKALSQTAMTPARNAD